MKKDPFGNTGRKMLNKYKLLFSAECGADSPTIIAGHCCIFSVPAPSTSLSYLLTEVPSVPTSFSEKFHLVPSHASSWMPAPAELCLQTHVAPTLCFNGLPALLKTPFALDLWEQRPEFRCGGRGRLLWLPVPSPCAPVCGQPPFFPHPSAPPPGPGSG